MHELQSRFYAFFTTENTEAQSRFYAHGCILCVSVLSVVKKRSRTAVFNEQLFR